MKIHIEDNWYLVSDEKQYIIAVEKERVIKGEKEKYMDYKTFHRTIKHALTSYLDKRIKTSKCTTFEGVFKKMEENYKLLDELLEKVNMNK